jgi:hypothetical protein
MQKSNHNIFRIPVGDELAERGYRRLLREYFVHYLGGNIKAGREKPLLERLTDEFAEPDGLAKMFTEYAPEFRWFEGEF